MNFREFTSKIAKSEGKKKQVSIGNVREVTRLVLTELAGMEAADMAALLKKYHRKSLREELGV